MKHEETLDKQMDRLLRAAGPVLAALKLPPQEPPPEVRHILNQNLAAVFSKRQQLSREQMKRLLLSLLCKQSAHGIVLADQLAAANFSLKDAGEGAIYGILNELEEASLVVSEWSERGPRMAKLYRATDRGRHQIEEQTRSSPELETWLRAVLKTT